MFGTVPKPKIIIYGQWTVPDARPGKKMQKMQCKNLNTQMPPTYQRLSSLSLITAQRSSSHLRTPKAKIPKVDKTKK